MSVAVAVIDGSTLVMAADSQWSTSYVKATSANAKLMTFGHALSGVVGNPRVLNVLSTMVPPDEFRLDYSWLVREYVPLLMNTLKDAKALQESDGIASMPDTALLIGGDGSLFTVHSDFSVMEHCQSYAAIGSGQEVAIGALAALSTIPPADRARRAIEIVSENTPWVGGRIDLLTTVMRSA